MLALFLTLNQGVVADTSSFFAGNGTSVVGGTTNTATGSPPMEKGLLGSSKCGGGSVKQYGSEELAEFGKYGCIGGSGGGAWEIHAYGQFVKTLEMWWGGGVPNDGIGGICIILTDGSHQCIGTQNRGNYCSHQFDTDNQEKLWTLQMHGNGIGTRVGRLEFKTMLNDGSSNSFECGNKHTAYEATNVDGKAISGFFGQAGADLDQLGILLAKPTCDLVKREVIAMECVNKSGENCLSTWVDGGKYATAQQICNGCATSESTSCGFGFSLTQTHTISTTSSKIKTAGTTLSFAAKFSEKFLGVVGSEATTTVTGSYSKTWSKSETQTTTTTTTINSQCSATMRGGHAVMAYANMRAGDMVADMRFTVRTTTTCDSVGTTEVHDGTVTITNVAVLAEVSTCTFEDMDCNATNSPTATPAPTPTPEWTLLDNTNIGGGDIGGCSTYPDEDIRADDDKIAECEHECAENSDCFAIVCHPWGTMLKSYKEPTETTAGYKTYVITRPAPPASSLEDVPAKRKSLAARMNPRTFY